MATTITLKLDVIPGGKGGYGIVLVPGQEPPSDCTSATMLTFMRGKPATCEVKEILDHIPGSYILYADNWANNIGVRKRWLVLPPRVQVCCDNPIDYYGMIRSLAKFEEPEEEKFDACDVFNTGIYPTPGWENIPEPEPSPYDEEGGSPWGPQSYSPGTVPPWQKPPKVGGTYYQEER